MIENDAVSMAGPRLAIRVAEMIRAAHSRSGLSHEEIASRLGVSVGRVSQILNGDGNFHIATVGRMFAALDCGVDLRAVDAQGEAVTIPGRRRSQRGSRRGGQEVETQRVSSISDEERVHIYRMSLVGEDGGFDGVFVSALKTRRQSLAGGFMVPVAEGERSPSNHDEARVNLNVTAELVGS